MGDLEQPGTKTRPALWLSGAADQAEPGLLDKFPRPAWPCCSGTPGSGRDLGGAARIRLRTRRRHHFGSGPAAIRRWVNHLERACRWRPFLVGVFTIKVWALVHFSQLYEFIAQPERVVAPGRAGECGGVLQRHAASVAAIALELLGEGGHGGAEAQVVAGSAWRWGHRRTLPARPGRRHPFGLRNSCNWSSGPKPQTLIVNTFPENSPPTCPLQLTQSLLLEYEFCCHLLGGAELQFNFYHMKLFQVFRF